MNDTISISPDEIEILESADYSADIEEHFSSIPVVAKPLFKNAKAALRKIEKMLYSAPAFINILKSSIPEEILQVILTDEQKSLLNKGVLKLIS